MEVGGHLLNRRSAYPANQNMYIETGGLFRLLVRLMAAESPYSDRGDMDQLCRLLTRYYQIRDDYQNLVSEEVSVITEHPPKSR